MDPDFRIRRLEAENQRLKRAVEELSILNEVALAVSSTSSLNEIVELIVQKCVKHLRVEQGAVLLLDQQEEAAPLRTMVRRAHSSGVGIPYRLGDQITGWMLKNQRPLLINDLLADSRFRLPAEASEVVSLLCVPLRLTGRMIGVLSVFNKQAGDPFSETDARLLTIIAAQSAQLIENARLHEEELAYKRVEQELQTARLIQQKLLPKGPPQIPGYDLAGRSESATHVGGDYYDFLPVRDHLLGLCLADVSGKGISAALLMAYVQATIRSQSLTEATLAEQLSRTNRLLFENTESNKFVTMFYGLFDPATHTLHYSNAGHNPPMLFGPSGGTARLEEGGPVLGVLPTFQFDQAMAVVQPGDVLVIYSDGCTEAMDKELQEFGEARLREVVGEHRQESSATIVRKVFERVQAFAGAAPQTDDMTVVVLKRL